MTQIVEPEIPNLRSLEQVIETPFQSLTLALRSALRREDPFLVDHLRISPNLRGELTRRYLNIGRNSRKFYRYLDGEYVEIARTAALEHVRG